jgi:hypothetical protein
LAGWQINFVCHQHFSSSLACVSLHSELHKLSEVFLIERCQSISKSLGFPLGLLGGATVAASPITVPSVVIVVN